MTMNDDELSMLALITSLFQELLHPIITLNASLDILKGKVPARIDATVQEIGRASRKLKEEVHYLYGHVAQEFDLKSPEAVVMQLHRNTLQWKKHEKAISYSLEKLQREIASGFILDDPDINAIMKKIVFNAFKDFQNLVRVIEGLQSRELLEQIKMQR